jgi:hypothetical protein
VRLSCVRSALTIRAPRPAFLLLERTCLNSIMFQIQTTWKQSTKTLQGKTMGTTIRTISVTHGLTMAVSSYVQKLARFCSLSPTVTIRTSKFKQGTSNLSESTLSYPFSWVLQMLSRQARLKANTDLLLQETLVRLECSSILKSPKLHTDAQKAMIYRWWISLSRERKRWWVTLCTTK